MHISKVYKGSSRFWLLWPFGAGAFVMIVVGQDLLSQSGIGFPGELAVTVAAPIAYIFIAALIMERLGATRSRWMRSTPSWASTSSSSMGRWCSMGEAGRRND